MLLKRISGRLPPYLADLIPILETADIRTTENVMFTHESTLNSLFPAIPRHLLDLLRAHCLDATAPSFRDGTESPMAVSSNGVDRVWRGWGPEELDKLLMDWDGIGILEIAGPRRAGKSLLALHAALKVLVKDSQATCVWIDTSGSFDPQRAKSILSLDSTENIEGVLNRLVVMRCFSVEPDMHEAFGKIEASLEDSSENTDQPRVKVIVIDSITNLFKDALMPTTSQGHAAMISLMADLASDLTYKYGLLTMITNSTASALPFNPLSNFSVTTLKPALGTAFTYHSDISLLVQETGKIFGMIDPDERDRVRAAPGLRGVVEVIKSRVTPSGSWAVFETNGVSLLNVVAPSQEDIRTLRMSAGLPTGQQRPLMGPLRETLAP
ncbi:hypothetical protein BD324DRAFT_637144 [Kockovaella imperatae]|uniref:Rad51-like C-terminal domain-containing protein n=1 Tax=Kockovaella imperatae TaxID=4999 RepID=A0A1Y1U876_9TREE|nr:hypothetical protein BD324DRAFT_637144 [Kockovaella imperatae]ORX34218.1 hypothetical protein BD324DRAFT_637144 [Kockovaella imperatae]